MWQGALQWRQEFFSCFYACRTCDSVYISKSVILASLNKTSLMHEDTGAASGHARRINP
jgi:hypothetical protein